MFEFSKIFLAVTNPGAWLLALLGIGTLLLWTRRRRAGRAILSLTVLFLLAISILPAGEGAIAVLEDRFPAARTIEPPVHGIIVLGGAVNQFLTRYRRQPALKQSAERLTEFVALARRFPRARLVYSGGSAAGFGGAKESEVARLLFAELGLDPARVAYEDESRNTYENAVFSYRLLHPRPGERWVLVTSAFHMPRAMGAFRKAGWHPLPYPVDYRTFGTAGLNPRFDLRVALNDLETALHEWVGLLAYRLLGRSDDVFPGP